MQRRRILIVDDEIGSTRMLKANLEFTGNYEVCVENNSAKAMGVARQFNPHLILLDIIMPDVSGTQLATLLHNDPGLSRIPIVFLTAASTGLLPQDSDPIVQGRPCIPKPAGMEEIMESVERNLLPWPDAPAGEAHLIGTHNEPS
jgi:CheY-like chemotaxis protein